jgi:hypothetical protein
MRAFIALHNIDSVSQGHLTEVMNIVMATLSVDEYMTQIAFIFPKVQGP